MIYMRKIVSALETTLGLDYGYIGNSIRFVSVWSEQNPCLQQRKLH